MMKRISGQKPKTTPRRIVPKIKPIRPDQVHIEIPDAVIVIFNNFIRENWNGYRSSFALRKIADAIRYDMGLPDDEDIAGKGWLDIEPLYKNAGWIVRFHSPDPGESFPSYFSFTKPKEGEVPVLQLLVTAEMLLSNAFGFISGYADDPDLCQEYTSFLQKLRNAIDASQQ